jgi:hypothetical protein
MIPKHNGKQETPKNQSNRELNAQGRLIYDLSEIFQSIFM